MRFRHPGDSRMLRAGECGNFGKIFMEVIVKIEKTNTMTNIWGNTKTKTDKDKNDGE